MNGTISELIGKEYTDNIHNNAYHETKNYIYWTSSSGKITRLHYPSNDNYTEVIVHQNEETFASGIAVDSINDYLYWSNHSENIVRSNLDGTEITTILDFSRNGSVGSLEIDLEKGRMDLSDDFIFLSDLTYMYQVTKKSSYSDPWMWFSKYNIGDIKVYQNTGSKKYSEIKNEEKRSKDYLIDFSSDQAISDEYLDAGWYRFIGVNGNEMPLSPPGEMHCETIYPIWLNGTLPTEDDGNVSREACLQTENDICEQSIDIKIRNCGGYYVYYLQETPRNSSFCFGSGPVVCPVGTSCETGFYPVCSTFYPKARVLIAVQTELLEGSSFQIPGYNPTPSLLPVFRCKFAEGSNETYIYDIFWYINGIEITSYINIPMQDINKTILKHTYWIDSYKMNMEVQCAIRMRYSANSVPGPFQYSANFKAGLFPESYDYTVIEGESITISFKSTVPVGCIASHKDLMSYCDQSFYVFQPKKNQNIGTCSNNIAMKDIIFKAEFCGIKFGNTDWQEEKKLEVYGFSNGLYNVKDRSTYIKLSTSSVSTFNEMWQDFKIPDIKMTVIDSDITLTHRLCQSVNDPHITTFDGKYYHFMEIGEFVMYRNDKGPYWVHALLTNCGFGWRGSACHCAIAIRSRNSLFVIRTCKSVSRTKKELLTIPITNLISCNDNDLLIDYNQRRNEYKEPDFIKDDLTVDILSTPASSTNSISKTFCACEDQASSTESLDDFNTIQCNLTESTEFCSSSQQSGNQINSYVTSCTTSKRKRRSPDYPSVVRRSTADADESDDVTDFEPLVYDEDTNSTDVVTGDTSFLTDIINAMATNIMTEISRNESLFILNTTEGSQSIIHQITSKLCINNCSNNGICVSEKEQCRAVLYVIGLEGREIYNTFNFGENEADKLEVLLKKFEDYCIPKKNVTVIRHRFNTRVQNPSESIDQYLTDLKLIAKNCEFEHLKDGLIRDRIVCGTNSSRVKERLLREDGLTLDKAVGICRADEESRKQMKTLNEEEQVHALRRKTQNHRTNRNEGYAKKGPSRRDLEKRESNSSFSCGKCGTTHERRNCPAYGKKCHKCKKPNHYQKFCKSKFSKSVHGLDEYSSCESDGKKLLRRSSKQKNGNQRKCLLFIFQIAR
ncbi:unnamed protein product [Mytilus coruscus]|uniref:VWFD domain-containing protein n=1 Tax=Mytilus coruscus TaxID=42192 RepID=A0A6J8DUK5_MYTCO|nr:unnamed protein product [Mytilus coruscus]